jgi:hypothetical protein
MPKLTRQNLSALDQGLERTRAALRRNASSATFVGTTDERIEVEAAVGGGAASPFYLGPVDLMDNLSQFDASVDIALPPPISDPVEMDEARAVTLFKRAAKRYKASLEAQRPQPPPVEIDSANPVPRPPQAKPLPPLVTMASPCGLMQGLCYIAAYEVTTYLKGCLRGSGFVIKSVCVAKSRGASFSSPTHYFTVVGRAGQAMDGAIVVDETWAQFGDPSRAIKDVKPLCVIGGLNSITSLGDFARHLGRGAGLMLDRYRTGLSALGQ